MLKEQYIGNKGTKATHAREVRIDKPKRQHIPTGTDVKAISVKLSLPYLEALREMYPGVSDARAIKMFITLRIKIEQKENV